MKLDMDCVRDILLCVEENTGIRRSCFFVDTGLNGEDDLPGHQTPLTDRYGNDVLIYHIRYCVEAGLLAESVASSPYEIIIDDLTPKGHSFLEDIRDDKIWAGVKGVAVKVGSRSLEALIQIASSVITEIIRSHFHL